MLFFELEWKWVWGSVCALLSTTGPACPSRRYWNIAIKYCYGEGRKISLAGSGLCSLPVCIQDQSMGMLCGFILFLKTWNWWHLRKEEEREGAHWYFTLLRRGESKGTQAELLRLPKKKRKEKKKLCINCIVKTCDFWLPNGEKHHQNWWAS